MKSLKVLIVVLGLVSWISTPPQAKAVTSCDASNGRPCNPAWSPLNCFWSTGEQGYCLCEPVTGQPGFYWVCRGANDE